MQAVGTTRTVSAYNSARLSANIIHSDEYARSRGFRGGLVPGTDICGYLTHPAIAHWGDDWLRQGQGSYRLLSPVYEGDQATTTVTAATKDALEVEVAVEGELCARASFKPDHGVDEASLPPVPTLTSTAEPPAASEQTLAPGVVLARIERDMSVAGSAAVLDELRESLPVFREQQWVHTGYLLRLANWALCFPVRLGPWIHVGSTVQNFRPCPAGRMLHARALVTDNFDKKGHRFVELDIRLEAEGTGLVSRVLHTAIWQLRPET